MVSGGNLEPDLTNSESRFCGCSLCIRFNGVPKQIPKRTWTRHNQQQRISKSTGPNKVLEGSVSGNTAAATAASSSSLSDHPAANKRACPDTMGEDGTDRQSARRRVERGDVGQDERAGASNGEEISGLGGDNQADPDIQVEMVCRGNSFLYWY